VSQQISTQPPVVLRSSYVQLRALLGLALILLVGLAAAVVVLATDDDATVTSVTRPAPAAEFQLPSHARIHGVAPVPDPSVTGTRYEGRDLVPGTRYDGGPDEGTRGIHVAPATPGMRYDGGPDEGTRGLHQVWDGPGIRYDGGPEEGTRGAGR
jgi:hypothetical protein